jgi:hypothetical protein
MTVIFQISVEINSVSKIQIIQIIHQKSSIHIQKSMIFIIRIMPKSTRLLSIKLIFLHKNAFFLQYNHFYFTQTRLQA